MCDCTYSAREDYFSDNQTKKELGLIVLTSTQGMKWCLEHETSESSLRHSKEQLLLLLLMLLDHDSGLVSDTEVAVETSSKTLNISLVVIFLLLMNFQVQSIAFHKASSCACACEYPLFMNGGFVQDCVLWFACVQRS